MFGRLCAFEADLSLSSHFGAARAAPLNRSIIHMYTYFFIVRVLDLRCVERVCVCARPVYYVDRERESERVQSELLRN